MKRNSFFGNFFKKVRNSIAKSQFVESTLQRLFPELRDRVHIHGIFSDILERFKQDRNQNPYTTHQTSSWVYRAIKVWQDLISSVEDIMVVNKQNNQVEHTIIDKLMSTPNPDMSPCELWQRWALEMGSRGEIGFEVVYSGSEPTELWPHCPDDLLVRAAETGRIYARVENYKIERTNITEYELEKEEMIFFKFYNPKNPYRGLAPLHAVREATLNDQLAVAWNRFFFKNQARPDFLVFSKEGLTPRERKQIEDELATKFGLAGIDNEWGVGRPLVLEKGITDIKPIGHPPKDIEWANGRKMNRDEIGGVFGVPRELMFADIAKYENLSQAEMLTWVLTIVPLLKLRDDKLTHFFRFIGLLDNKHKMKTDLSRVWPLRRTMEAIFNQAKDFFSMGVPFALINNYFGFGMERFKSDMNSHPFGTRSSFNESGEVIATNSDISFTEEPGVSEP